MKTFKFTDLHVKRLLPIPLLYKKLVCKYEISIFVDQIQLNM